MLDWLDIACSSADTASGSPGSASGRSARRPRRSGPLRAARDRSDGVSASARRAPESRRDARSASQVLRGRDSLTVPQRQRTAPPNPGLNVRSESRAGRSRGPLTVHQAPRQTTPIASYTMLRTNWCRGAELREARPEALALLRRGCRRRRPGAETDESGRVRHGCSRSRERSSSQPAARRRPEVHRPGLGPEHRRANPRTLGPGAGRHLRWRITCSAGRPIPPAARGTETERISDY